MRYSVTFGGFFSLFSKCLFFSENHTVCLEKDKDCSNSKTTRTGFIVWSVEPSLKSCPSRSVNFFHILLAKYEVSL